MDRETRVGETTPFTPVDVRTVPAGESLTIGVCEGEPRFDAGPGCAPHVTLRYEDDGFRSVAADGAAHRADPVVILGRFRLALSQQGDRGRILVHDPQAPDQRAFQEYRWYPPDPAYRFVVEVEPYPQPSPARMATTTGLFKTYRRHGRVRFPADGEEHSLSVYLPEGGDPAKPGDYFIPFRDATAGKETYPVGRYVRMERGEGGEWILDFNRAGNPNCAYNPHWNCPIPPRENVLEIAIPAGELPYSDAADH